MPIRRLSLYGNEDSEDLLLIEVIQILYERGQVQIEIWKYVDYNPNLNVKVRYA